MDRLPPADFRRGLREASTTAEKRLWSLLRARRFAGLKFRRQHTIGPYVVDFFCHEARLAVEVDGSVHDDPARAAYDTRRERALHAEGVRVVRVTNRDALREPEAVLARIAEAAKSPLPRGEGGP